LRTNCNVVVRNDARIRSVRNKSDVLHDALISSSRPGDSLITRRSVLLATGISLFVTRRISHGQTRSKVPRIGFLWFASMSDPSSMQYREAFRQRLTALGYVQGKNILIEERSAEGHPERLNGIARELAANVHHASGTHAEARDVPQQMAR